MQDVWLHLRFHVCEPWKTCVANTKPCTYSLFGFVESSLIFFLTGIQVLAIASTAQWRREKIPHISPFFPPSHVQSKAYFWAVVKRCRTGGIARTEGVPWRGRSGEASFALASLARRATLDREEEWQSLIHFILPGSKIRPQQIGHGRHRLRPTPVRAGVAETERAGRSSEDAEMLAHGDVCWIICDWLSSIHSPTSGPGQHLWNGAGERCSVNVSD